jgi:hypothetical protein
LTVVILALGTSTAWLAIDLRDARQELAELRGSSAPATTSPAISAEPAHIRAPPVQSNPAAISPSSDQPARRRDAMQAQSDVWQRAANLARNAWVRTWLNDPPKRAKALAETRKNLEVEFPRQLLNLDDDSYNQLLDSVAASDLRYAETMYRCNTDPACDPQSTIESQMETNRRELVALLGDEKAQRLETYRDNAMERMNVGSLRGSLPDSMRLSDAQAGKLTDALGEERRRMVKEWEQRGEIANSRGLVNFPGTQDLEQRFAEATELQRRQSDRAAEVLTPAQLEIFTKHQEELLESARASWELEDQAEKSP